MNILKIGHNSFGINIDTVIGLYFNSFKNILWYFCVSDLSHLAECPQGP